MAGWAEGGLELADEGGRVFAIGLGEGL